MRHLFILLTSIIISVSCFASNGFDHSHKVWSDILHKYVEQSANTTVVNYNALKNNSGSFNGYLKSLEEVTEKDFQSFNSNQKLAFLINTYNAYTIKLIIDNYPIKSIKDIGGVFSSPWKRKFIHLFNEKISLDNIEHDKIRKNFQEPRIHFAVVCASIGCPSLRNEAYIAEKLNEQLEDAANIFLSDSSRNHYDRNSKTLEIIYDSLLSNYLSSFPLLSASLQLSLLPKPKALTSPIWSGLIFCKKTLQSMAKQIC